MNTSLVAIDALNFHGKFKPEEQYHESIVLRELNKAFIGFTCKDERGDLVMNQIALRQGEYPEEDEMFENTFETDDLDDLMEVTCDDKDIPTALSDNIISEILNDAKKKADDTCKLTLQLYTNKIPIHTIAVHSYADNLVSNILTSVKFTLSQPIQPPNSDVQTYALPTSESLVSKYCLLGVKCLCLLLLDQPR